MRLAKHQWSLAAGMGLPLLLALWYALTVFVPRLYIGPPQYDMVFLTHYAGDSVNALRMEVKEGKAVATFVGENFGYGWPRLYRYRPATGDRMEITIPRPRHVPQRRPYNRPAPPPEQELYRPVPVPGLEALRLDASPTAPDGYTFALPAEEDDWFLQWGMNAGAAYVVKEGHRVAIPRPPDKGVHSITFLGWVLP